MSQEIIATGRRKDAVARIRMTPGTGVIEINGRPFEDPENTAQEPHQTLQPLEVAKSVNVFDIRVNATGGGMSGQAGAVRLAISRALTEHNPELRPLLKPAGLLRRDPRMKERKKSGQPGARKRFQFSKR